MLHIISLIITPLLLLGITHLFSILFLQPSHYFPVWIWSEKLDANIPLILFLLIYPKSFALVDMRVSANSNLVFEQVLKKFYKFSQLLHRYNASFTALQGYSKEEMR